MFYSLNEMVFKYDRFHLDNWREYILLILLGSLLTLSIEAVGQILAPSWIYAFRFFTQESFYTSMAAWILFIPATVESYLFVKNLMKPKLRDIKNSVLMFVIFIAGLLFTGIGIFWGSPVYQGLPFCFFILGISFIADTFVYIIIRRSIYMEALHSLRYALCIVLSAFLIGFTVEFINTFHNAWSYVNVPLLELTILNVPVPILMGWIPLVVIWLEVYYLTVYLYIKKRDKKKFI